VRRPLQLVRFRRHHGVASRSLGRMQSVSSSMTARLRPSTSSPCSPEYCTARCAIRRSFARCA